MHEIRHKTTSFHISQCISMGHKISTMRPYEKWRENADHVVRDLMIEGGSDQ